MVHNTQMHRVLETGKPILIDLLTNKAGTFVVSRIPLRDEAGQRDRRARHRAVRPSRDHAAAADPQVRRTCSATWTTRGASWPRQRRTKYTLASFVGSSPAAVEVKRQARRAAQSSSPVLLLGETGTGKELLAHAIHAASARARGPFVSVNIAAVPDTLLEAEFFGVAPGAYTGADRKGRDGKFKLADGGTLFLDEIGDMPLSLQPKLLRALQEGEIEPLGSNKVVPFDARVIAATSRDLGGAGARRASSAKTCTTGSTCCRSACRRCASAAPTSRRWSRCWREDMALRNGTRAARAERARRMALLSAQNWRGNIRELRNVLEQAAMRSDSQHIEVRAAGGGAARGRRRAHRRRRRRRAARAGAAAGAVLLRPLAEQVAELERQAIAGRAWPPPAATSWPPPSCSGISRAKLYERLEAAV